MDGRPSGCREAPVDRTRRTGRLVRRPRLSGALACENFAASPGCLVLGAHRGRNSATPGLVHGLPGALLEVRPQVRVGVQVSEAEACPRRPWTVFTDSPCRMSRDA